MNTTILIVEDEIAIQELIALNVEMAGYKVKTASSAQQARSIIQEKLPDLILMDWMIPGQSGLSLIKEIRQDKRSHDVPIIMLTAKADESNKIEGFEVGVDDYITKPFSPKELLARIKAVLRRKSPQSLDDMITFGPLILNPHLRQLQVDDTLIQVGPAEFKLLHFFVTHPDRLYTRTQLLDLVWGDHVFLEERTIDVHIRRLRKVLDKVNLRHFVQTIRGGGYRFSADEKI
ncbi:phosphate regulon transcriptional regulator PhoB [Basilea psittacipulmonis]|uniref:Phosphate regulon transcriptional regulatory protein PhoB n=1 Tax=Basilea psittacipulmonis DSM 24701 TaxID=1072685 RepID=A0A077DFJ6_9BURK|nr:phosphate regulon transcriptional regulator PhoB [Basilea psittacipulmonis]AIL32137.1 chemotaxis protein CheY [Basilea psittacipulmonis DSM 24701]